MRLSFFTFIICALVISGNTKAQPLSMVEAQATTGSYKPGGPGAVKCLVQWSLVKNGKNMKILFFAQNDVRNIPMQLTFKGKELPIKVKPSDKRFYYTVFTPDLKDIFFKDKSPAGYSWKWQGAAKAPLSPLAEAAGQRPHTIKYWFTIQVQGASFSTDPNYIDIKW